MQRELQRYMARNQLVEIIYLDRYGNTSQRTLRLLSINPEYVKAYCFARKAQRSFFLNRILAVAPGGTRNAV